MTAEELLIQAEDFNIDENEIEKIEAERLAFLQRFPKESLTTMTVEEYADTKTKDCFIYWLEQRNLIGGIGGGNASKFGIYRSASGHYSKGSGKNRVTLLGDALQEEFLKLKEGYLKVFELADGDRYGEIQQLKLPIFNTVLLKVLHIYYPEKFLNVFSAPVLKKAGESLKIDVALFEPHRLVQLNHTVLQLLKQHEELSDWSTGKLGRFVWERFSSVAIAEDKDAARNYWLVGHTYETDGSQKDYFIQNECVGIGFLREDLSDYLEDDNLADIIEAKEPELKGQQAIKAFLEIKLGDYIALKSTYTRKDGGVTKSVLKVSAIGRAKADAVDGYSFNPQRGHLLPVEWFNLDEKEFIGYGGYRKTIAKTKNRNTVNYVFLGQPNTAPAPKPELNTEAVTPQNIILYGPPGTGKTYEVSRKALELTTDAQTFEEISNDGREAIQNEYTRLTRIGRVRFVTFHQSYSYEDFIEGLRSDGQGNFIPEDGLFKRAAIEALYAGLNKNVQELSDEVQIERLYDYKEKKEIVMKALEQGDSFDFANAESFVLIIDEINRGNISKIFGELLTLIEEDKRFTKDNQLIVELPYTKERFTLPPNLHIIGTMNTADRSIALMDTALRRRFLFEEMMPNPELLDTVGSLDLEGLLTIINKRIEVLYDRNHTIGHAYFINAKTEEDVIEVVQHKIIPLLQEYFYDDWEKIGMVLGGIGRSKEGPYLIYEEQIDYSHLFKQSFTYPTRKQYRVKSKITSQEITAIYEI